MKTFTDRKGDDKMSLMMDYIMEQPALLAKAVENRAAIAKDFAALWLEKRPDRVLLVGSGTSNNACQAAAPFMQEVLGVEVSVTAPSALLSVPAGNPLLIYVSQGGNSTNTVAAIERTKGYPSVILTGNPDGTLNTMGDLYVEIPCGEEKVGPKTKGYMLSILTLYVLALEAGKAAGSISGEKYTEIAQALEKIGGDCADNIAATNAWLDANYDALASYQFYYYVGKGIGRAISCEFCLKLMETVLYPGGVMEFEEFLHGPTCSVSWKTGGFYLLPEKDDADYERVEKAIAFHRTFTDKVFAVGGSRPSGDADGRDLILTHRAWYTAPFEYILPGQIISAVVTEKEGIQRASVSINDYLSTKLKKEY